MTNDWTKLYKKYKGMWVALKDDNTTVISSGENLKDILEIAHKKGYKNPSFMRIPEESIEFAG